MTTSEDAALPRAVALLWGLDQPGERGPKRGLSLDQIVETAIAVADAEGAAALSMNRVAKELGFTAMSLYRYVDSKTTLLQLMLDRVIGVPPELDPAAGWRAGLRAWAAAEFETIARRPWFLDVPVPGPPSGPNNMAWLEAGLSALAGTAVPESVRLQLVMNLSLYVIGRSWAVRDFLSDTGEDADYDVAMRTVLDPARYPHLVSAFAHRAFENEEIDWARADFEFGLERMLDGYENLIRAYER
ncbi:TetR/AcrR family transcriptional regulator C-terminal domain-containing protein [Nocardia farcinica]|uniref:TetR/AcrR family transcriptional regulator n=1 Tax=Nocardia farcinica TaxID=37329 RepID=UPI001894A71F|nr:TetR/AcrR family transcriptional regulator C-terminal domain-containing protein [Nocardia farcinica]MBF6442307.1 TetR/AcrR family transcriptional regulator C-terminal domain-containing protein [Nocardia farcinica]